jgi:hypothetical protein
MPLSNNLNSARKVGDAFGHAYTTVTGAKGDHVRAFHDTVLAYLFDDLKAAGSEAAQEALQKNTFSHCISKNLTDRDYRNLQGILPDLMLGCSLPPGQPSNSLDGYRHLGELKTLLQRNMSVEKRAEHIQLDLEKNAKDLGAGTPATRCTLK